tara:strand:- start:133 stop:504 length:372 start_codon:yes stop_codon:yes gene_type:complete
MGHINNFQDFLQIHADASGMSREEYTAYYLSENLITEKDVKIEIEEEKVTFMLHEYENNYVFIAKSSKDLDKLMDIDKDMIPVKLLEFANNKFKEIKFIRNNGYLGAGYALMIDTDSVVNKLK